VNGLGSGEERNPAGLCQPVSNHVVAAGGGHAQGGEGQTNTAATAKPMAKNNAAWLE